MNPFSFFSLLSLFYAWVGLRTVHEAWRGRAALFDARVTAADRSMLDRLAFFVLIPLGVLLHELGHAAATLQMGGQVLEFRWLLYFGYVLPGGSFTPLQDWWITLAGNLVGLLTGLAALALLRAPLKPAGFYLVWSFARLQLFYALIFYPVFSSFTRFGDWVTIYSPQGGVWSWVTAGLHLLLLLGYAGLARSSRFRTWLVNRYAPTDLAAAFPGVDPDSADGQNALGSHYARQGEVHLAERSFRAAEALDPTDPRPLMNRARLAATRGRHDRALALLQRALGLIPPGEPALRAYALSAMAEAELEHRRPKAALAHLDAALALTPANASLALMRGRIRALTGDREGARADFARAAASGDPGLAQVADAELSALEGAGPDRSGSPG